ncbi:uncharacterized protein TNCV_3156241 [Trichonephila clavipes]|nr:uncharacterized protein TNCV_3156241 [Trichonephila clavipes]
MQCGKTQNANESIHSVIWKNCPKETFVSKKRLEMGVISAIGGYNFGCFNSLAIEHNELSSVSVDISHKRDKRRLAQSEKKKNSSDWRKKRIINKLAKSSKITKNIKKKGKHMVLLAVELGADFREARDQPKTKKNTKGSWPKSTIDTYQLIVQRLALNEGEITHFTSNKRSSFNIFIPTFLRIRGRSRRLSFHLVYGMTSNKAVHWLIDKTLSSY